MTQQPWNPMAPQQQQQQQSSPFNPFQSVSPVAETTGVYPSNRQLLGRLLGFWVTSFTPNVPSQFKDKDGNQLLQNTVVANVVVLDGEPMLNKIDGQTGMPGEAFPFPLTAPIEFEGMTFSQAEIVKALQHHVNGAPQLGRMTLGAKRGTNHPPYKLEVATSADLELAGRYLAMRDQIKAQWAARFAQAQGPAAPHVSPFQTNSSNPFGQQPTQQYPQYQQQQQQYPQYQQPTPYAQQNPGTGPFGDGPGNETPADPWATPAPQAPAQDSQPTWNPAPQGPPTGWPGA